MLHHSLHTIHRNHVIQRVRRRVTYARALTRETGIGVDLQLPVEVTTLADDVLGVLEHVRAKVFVLT